MLCEKGRKTSAKVSTYVCLCDMSQTFCYSYVLWMSKDHFTFKSSELLDQRDFMDPQLCDGVLGKEIPLLPENCSFF